VFGPPAGPVHEVRASRIPILLHMALVLLAGLYLPGMLVAWFQRAAELLG